MTGRTGGRAACGSHSAWPDQAPVASTTAGGTQLLTRRGPHPAQPPLRRAAPRRPRSRSAPRPPRRERREQRLDQRPRVDRRLLRRMHAAVQRRRQAGLQLAAAARRQPLGAEAERALEIVDGGAAPPPRRGRGRRAGRRAASSRSPCRSQPPARRRSPDSARRRRGSSRAASGSPKVSSPTGASIPAATRVAPAGGSARSSTSDPRAALGGAPGAGEPDDSGPHDDRVVTSLLGQTLPPPALPGSGPDGR